MKRPSLEMADIVHGAGDDFIKRSRRWISWQHQKVLLAITRCRTAALGGHRDQCSSCGHSAISYNSCRNRHCPGCQGNARVRWLEARQRELLPTRYASPSRANWPRLPCNLLNATVDAGISKFIFSSSCAVYGAPEQLPITETTPRFPLSPYGQTKAAFEDALKSYSAAYGLKFVALRYFNAAGADESGMLGELRSPETHLIPLVLKAASGHSPAVSIFGNDYDTPDGTCIRDYVHVNDLASAHVSALDLLIHKGESDVFNLGTGTGFSVLEVISAAEEVSALHVPRLILPRRPGDPPILICDGEYARKKLHWSPQRGLIEILSTAWKWQIINTAVGALRPTCRLP